MWAVPHIPKIHIPAAAFQVVPTAPKDQEVLCALGLITYVCPLLPQPGWGAGVEAGATPLLSWPQDREEPGVLHSPLSLCWTLQEGLWPLGLRILSLPPASVCGFIEHLICSGPVCFHLWLITFFLCIHFLRLQNEINKSQC